MYYRDSLGRSALHRLHHILVRNYVKLFVDCLASAAYSSDRTLVALAVAEHRHHLSANHQNHQENVDKLSLCSLTFMCLFCSRAILNRFSFSSFNLFRCSSRRIRSFSFSLIRCIFNDVSADGGTSFLIDSN